MGGGCWVVKRREAVDRSLDLWIGWRSCWFGRSFRLRWFAR